jgi:hypothetical protein
VSDPPRPEPETGAAGSPERPRPWPTAALVAAAAALALAPLAPHWLRGKTLAFYDTMSVYGPLRGLVDEALRGLRLPLWNPFSGTGLPLLADGIHGVLHPVSVLAAWLHADGVDLLIGAHLALAASGAMLLARELGATRTAALLAAAVYAGSGFVLSMAGGYLLYLAGAGSLPLAVAGLRRAAARPGPGALLLSAAGVALLALTGEYQGVMIAGALALALGWEAAGWRGAARATASGLAGLAVAGIQLLPSVTLLPLTDRAAAHWTRTPAAWSLAPWRLPELLLPGFFHGEDPFREPVFAALAGRERWPAWTTPYPFATSIFLGVLPLSLAVLGARNGRTGRVLALLALVSVWLALGPTLGADLVVGQLPIWSSFRYPEKLLGAFSLLVALLAATGVDRVARGATSPRSLILLTAALGAVGVLAALAASSMLPDALGGMARERVLRGGAHPIAAALALAAWGLGRRRLPARWSAAALASIAWVGMVAAMPWALYPGSPSARLHATGLALEHEPPGPRVLHPFLDAPIPTVDGLDRWDAVALADAARAGPAYNVRQRLDSMSDAAAMVPWRLSRIADAFGAVWPLGARRYAVTHAIVGVPLDQFQVNDAYSATRGATLARRLPFGQEVWAMPHRAWATFAPAVIPASSASEAVAETVRSFLGRSEAVVIESQLPFGTAPGRVFEVSREPELVRVEAESAGEATLVIADAWWPGWRATVDGRPSDIYPADALVRAVRWPAGRHVLEMRYDPPEVRYGAVLSVLGIALTGGAAYAWRRQRAGPPAGTVGARG